MGSATTESSNAEIRRLRAVLDAASEAYVCSDDAAVVVDCNRAAEALFGYRRERLIGQDLVALMSADELHGEHRSLYQRILAAGGTPQPVEVAIQRSDVAERHIEFSSWVSEVGGERLCHTLYRDVTERVRLQAQLAERARRLREAQALAGLGSWEWDLATDVVVWSAELYRLFGIDEGAPVTYATFTDRLHPEDREWVEAEVDAAALEGRTLQYEARILCTDGEVRWIAALGDRVIDDHGVPVRVVGTAHDITDRKVAEVELEQLAVTDSLTGLANRSLFEARLEAALEACRGTGEPVSLLLLDLDGFKPVNDIHGHSVGDTVLTEVSNRLAECIRPGDTLARVGGDEFGLVMPGADRSDATSIARRLIDAASAPVTMAEAMTVIVGASVGIAVCGTPASTVGELQRQADHAMYTAKRSGRGRHVVFTTELEEAGTDCLTVRPRDARAWAEYMVALRAEIARRKHEGALPETSRAPASVWRTLVFLLAAIEQLPHQREDADLPLPERVELEEFVFHQSLVHEWADALVHQGVLTTQQPTRAIAFWAQLRHETGTET